MKFTIEPGTSADIDELEKLYDELNDYLAATTNYPGWIKGVYPVREDAVAGVNDETLYVARYDGRIVGSVILNHLFWTMVDGRERNDLYGIYEEVIAEMGFPVSLWEVNGVCTGKDRETERGYSKRSLRKYFLKKN